MEIKFDNLEELMMKFPIDNKRNVCYTVEEYHVCCLTPVDLIVAKEKHPFGRYNKVEGNYYYCVIMPRVWYDHYLYDGTYWYIGEDSWNGVYTVLYEPKYEVINNERGLLRGSFKTEEEAYECVKKRYSKEEVCRF